MQKYQQYLTSHSFNDLYIVKQNAIEAPIADNILKIRVVSDGLVETKTKVKIKTIGITPKELKTTSFKYKGLNNKLVIEATKPVIAKERLDIIIDT